MKRAKKKIKIRFEVIEHEKPFDLNSKVIKRTKVEGIEYHKTSRSLSETISETEKL